MVVVSVMIMFSWLMFCLVSRVIFRILLVVIKFRLKSWGFIIFLGWLIVGFGLGLLMMMLIRVRSG